MLWKWPTTSHYHVCLSGISYIVLPNSHLSPQQVALYPFCKSAVGYKNCKYLTRKTHVHVRQVHTGVQTVTDWITINLQKKFYNLLCNENCIHRGLGKTRGYWGCPEAKAKFNFVRKYSQATVRIRRMERGTNLGLKAEKTALWSHPGGRVAILLPQRGWRVSERNSLLPFSEVTPIPQQLLPLTQNLPGPITL